MLVNNNSANENKAVAYVRLSPQLGGQNMAPEMISRYR